MPCHVALNEIIICQRLHDVNTQTKLPKFQVDTKKKLNRWAVTAAANFSFSFNFRRSQKKCCLLEWGSITSADDTKLLINLRYFFSFFVVVDLVIFVYFFHTQKIQFIPYSHVFVDSRYVLILQNEKKNKKMLICRCFTFVSRHTLNYDVFFYSSELIAFLPDSCKRW